MKTRQKPCFSLSELSHRRNAVCVFFTELNFVTNHSSTFLIMGNERKKHIPNLLRKHRKIVGYRQSEVAEILDLKSTNRISRWEKGMAAPGLLNLLKLSIIYSTLCDQLYQDLMSELRKEIIEKKENVLGKRKKKR